MVTAVLVSKHAAGAVVLVGFGVADLVATGAGVSDLAAGIGVVVCTAEAEGAGAVFEACREAVIP